MSVLTGPAIRAEVEAGRIVIDPFDPARVGPNSVNVRQADKLLIYEKMRSLHNAWGRQRGRYPDLTGVPCEPLDMAVDELTHEFTVPETGFTLYPGVLYLADTVEYTETPHHRPTLDGRSSVGRLGLFIHVTAGYGDIAFKGTFTCEFVVPYPLVIYPFVEIGQLSYTETVGEVQPYTGQYNGQRGPKKSGLHREFINGRYVGKPK